jgi:hypothetical protein
MFEAWLKCAVSKGMFSDELAVQCQPLGGAPRSFFVPKSKVADVANAEGRLHVRIFKKDQTVWAVLPTENKAIIPVDESDVMRT